MVLSVVIPAYNAANLLQQTLPALGRGSRVPDEILVVDDGCRDNTAEIAAQLGARVLRLCTNRGPAFCRNYAASAATGDVLVFLDADTRVDQHTLARMESRLADASLIGVIGAYDDQPTHPSVVAQFRNLSHRFVHCTAQREALTFWSGCGAVRKQALLAAGGFSDRYRRPSIEDIELGYRLTSRGERILLDPTITVTHLKAWTLASAVRTDLFDRGIPWMELLLERGIMPNDLNISIRHRVSTALAALATLWMGAALYFGATALGFAALLWIAACLLHTDLFLFLSKRKGVLFLAAAMLLFALQQICNLGAAIVGSARWLNRGMPSHMASEIPAREQQDFNPSQRVA